MLSSENHKLQASLGFLEACASLHANASDDPAMKAQIQLQTDRVRKALVATQAEAWELRERLCSCGEAHYCESEAVDLKAELSRLRGLLNVARCPNCDGSGAIPHGPTPDGDWEWQQCQWCGERAALSQPAEQVDPDDNRHLRMILHAYETGVGHGQQGRGATHDQWGNDDLTYAYQQGVRQGEKGKPVSEEPVQEPDLPLIARRQSWPAKYVGAAIIGGGIVPLTCLGSADFRIADIDEDGLRVVERTERTPTWARYRWRRKGGELWHHEARFFPVTSYDWQRIEDYNAHAQRGQEG